MVESECIRRARSGASHMRLRRARLARRMKSDKLQFVAFRLSRGLCRHLLRQTSVCRLPPFTWTMPSPSTTNFSLSPSAFHVDYAVPFYDKLQFVAFRLSRGLCRHLLRQTEVCRLPPFTWTMPSPSTTNLSLSDRGNT